MHRSNFVQSIRALAFVCMIAGASATYGQRTTEQFIPIGESPGISDKYSYIGEIVAVDREARTISVYDDGRLRTIKITAETRIWLDRSKTKRQNRPAGYDDCEVGRRVEVMHRGQNKDVADWIKIEAT